MATRSLWTLGILIILTGMVSAQVAPARFPLTETGEPPLAGDSAIEQPAKPDEAEPSAPASDIQPAGAGSPGPIPAPGGRYVPTTPRPTATTPIAPRPPIPSTAAPRSSTAVAAPPTPAVSIHVGVPSITATNSDIEYRIRVENRSAAAAHHVIVRNPLPSGATFVKSEPKPDVLPDDKVNDLQWRLGTLAAGAGRDIRLTLRPKDGISEVKNVARVQFEHGQCVTTRISRPGLNVKLTGPALVVANDSGTIKMEVTNTGAVPVRNVVVLASVPTDVLVESGGDAATPTTGGDAQRRWLLGTLQPGQCRIAQLIVRGRRPGAKAAIKAVVTAEANVRQESTWNVQITEPKLTLLQTGPEKIYASQSARYEILVRNSGTAVLRNVVVTESLPPDSELLRLTQGGQGFGDSVQWVFGRLEPGESKTMTLLLRSKSAGRRCLQATATADHAASQQADACTEFLGAVGVNMEGSAPASADVGKSFTYSAEVQNTGSAVAKATRLVVRLPAEVRLLRSDPATAELQSDELVFRIGQLNPGERRTVSLILEAKTAGEARFRARLEADDLPGGPIHETDSVRILGDGPRRTEPTKPPVDPPQPLRTPSEPPATPPPTNPPASNPSFVPSPGVGPVTEPGPSIGR